LARWLVVALLFLQWSAAPMPVLPADPSKDGQALGFDEGADLSALVRAPERLAVLEKDRLQEKQRYAIAAGAGALLSGVPPLPAGISAGRITASLAGPPESLPPPSFRPRAPPAAA
jgi:hypothetical protein